MKEKRLRFIILILIIAILGPALQNIILDTTPPTTYVNSALGWLLFLILLVTGMIKIAGKKKEGWIWLGTYCYYSMFKNPGAVAWLYLALTIGAIYTYYTWSLTLPPPKEQKGNIQDKPSN